MFSQSKATDITEFFNGAADRPSVDDEPMTDEQAALLKDLCVQANEPQEFDGELTRTEADEFIKEMRRRVAQPAGH